MSKFLTTPVDDLVKLVEEKPNCSVSYLEKSLKVPSDVIEKWLVILEEFEILSVNYKGFSAFISIHKKRKEKQAKANEVDLDRLRDEFIERSKSKSLSYEKIKRLWPVFISEYEDEIRSLFYEKARRMGYDAVKVDKAWARYRVSLMEFN